MASKTEVKLKGKAIVHCLGCHWEGEVKKLKPLTEFIGTPPMRFLGCPKCGKQDFEVSENRKEKPSAQARRGERK